MSGNRNKKEKPFIVNFIILQAEEFLIEWEGFSIFQCTWEPKTHIPCHILQDYKFGVVSLSEDNIRYVSDQFLSAIQQRLSRRTGAHFYLEIPLSTHRQLFGTDGDLRDFLFNKEDFHKFLFVSNTWDEFIYSKHGEGRRIHFPILVKPQLKWSKLHYNIINDKFVKAPRRPIEYWKIELSTERFVLKTDK